LIRKTKEEIVLSKCLDLPIRTTGRKELLFGNEIVCKTLLPFSASYDSHSLIIDQIGFQSGKPLVTSIKKPKGEEKVLF
jgi:hypothetical protein